MTLGHAGNLPVSIDLLACASEHCLLFTTPIMCLVSVHMGVWSDHHTSRVERDHPQGHEWAKGPGVAGHGTVLSGLFLGFVSRGTCGDGWGWSFFQRATTAC